MRTLITNDDLRRLMSGLSLACAAGLLLGAAFQPNLDEHDAAGPQMLMGESGARKVFVAYDPGVGRYAGQIPDHVIGTDWKRLQQPPEAETVLADQGDTVVYQDEEAGEPVEMARASWIDEPRGPVVYPSVTGNTDYEANLPAAPPPPSDIDADAG